MLETKECVIIIALLIGIFLVLSCVISNELLIYSATKTIETNETLSKNVHITNIWVVEHEWRSDWYVIGYMFETSNYVCSEEEKETTPWNCNKNPYITTLECVWFNVKTKEVHIAEDKIF